MPAEEGRAARPPAQKNIAEMIKAGHPPQAGGRRRVRRRSGAHAGEEEAGSSVVAPILRDVHLTVPRSGAAGSQGAVQEASVSCFTGRHSHPLHRGGGVRPHHRPTAPPPPAPPPGAPTTSRWATSPPAGYYHFRVKATDPTDAGNPTYSQDYTFTQPPDAVPPGPTVTVGAVTAHHRHRGHRQLDDRPGLPQRAGQLLHQRPPSPPCR